ncbi:flagellar hook-associated protein 2 [Paenibacillus sp. TRM 82003]|nr:flagellar hook-associated protein 2 [Paenibacillus sp. TRM 82003]MCI3923383.1 flagellar hook-associated protein 2 [Paenibacillus sp. TRM 82003]
MSMRVTGLSTGMDIDQIVKDLMEVNRTPVNRLMQERQWVNWQRDAYKDMNTKLREFRNTTLFEFKRESNFVAKEAALSGHLGSFTATAQPSAPAGSLTVSVQRLATASQNIGIIERRGIDPTLPLSGQLTTEELADLSISIRAGSSAAEFVPIGIGAGDTLNDVIQKINKDSGANAFYDEFTGRLSLTAKETGDQSTISVADGFLTKVFGVPRDTPAGSLGRSAKVTINGVETERQSNQFTVNGIAISLQATSGTAATTIQVNTNTDSIVDTIKNFLTDYNKLLDTMNTKLNETKYRDFAPLSDEQKKEMSEREIDLWDEKAKSGLLRRDSIVQKAYSELRGISSSFVDTGSTDIRSLAHLGISSTHYQDKGKLSVVDEQKLRAAINADPEAVMKLFSGKDDEGGAGEKVGLAERMYNSVEGVLKEISTKAGTSVFAETQSFNSQAILSKRLSEYDERIDKMNSRLQDLESRYYRQFTAMETAINRYNSQSSYLAGMFAGGQ